MGRRGGKKRGRSEEPETETEGRGAEGGGNPLKIRLRLGQGSETAGGVTGDSVLVGSGSEENSGGGGVDGNKVFKITFRSGAAGGDAAAKVIANGMEESGGGGKNDMGEGGEAGFSIGESPSKKARTVSGSSTGYRSDVDTSLRAMSPSVVSDSATGAAGGPEAAALGKVLNKLHTFLCSKDEYMFFAKPVDNSIAPGYDQIIKEPMDFETMQKNIDKGVYESVEQYRVHYELVMRNAMTYNTPDTIYHKVAKKLLKSGLKSIEKEKNALDRMINAYRKKTREKQKNLLAGGGGSGAHSTAGSSGGGKGTGRAAKDTPPKGSRGRPVRETIDAPVENPKRVETTAKIANVNAAQRLAEKYAPGVLKYSRNEKGEVVFNDSDNSPTLKIVSNAVDYEKTIPRLRHFSTKAPVLPHDKPILEYERNKIIPVNYLLTGPYSSMLPKYDSSKSNLSKLDSDLLYLTYGDRAGLHYANNVRNFTKDTKYDVRKHIDEILNCLTKGGDEVVKDMDEKAKENERIADKAANQNLTDCEPDSNVLLTQNEVENLKNAESVKDDNSSFLKQVDAVVVSAEGSAGAREPLEPVEKASSSVSGYIQALLDHNFYLMRELKLKQNERLVRGSIDPSEDEIKIAHRITNNLAFLSEYTSPGNLVTEEELKNAVEHGNPPEAIGSFGKKIRIDEFRATESENAGEDEQEARLASLKAALECPENDNPSSETVSKEPTTEADDVADDANVKGQTIEGVSGNTGNDRQMTDASDKPAEKEVREKEDEDDAPREPSLENGNAKVIGTEASLENNDESSKGEAADPMEVDSTAANSGGVQTEILPV